MAEVMTGGFVDAVPAVTELDDVEIRLEDLRLGVVLLHLAGGILLAELARDGLVAAIDGIGVEIAHELLRDRARAARMSRDGILDRAGDADEVDAIVRVEALVLDGDEGLRREQRQRRERNTGAPLRADLAEERAVATEDERGLRRAVDAPDRAGGLLGRGGYCDRGESCGEGEGTAHE